MKALYDLQIDQMLMINSYGILLLFIQTIRARTHILKSHFRVFLHELGSRVTIYYIHHIDAQQCFRFTDP